MTLSSGDAPRGPAPETRGLPLDLASETRGPSLADREALRRRPPGWSLGQQKWRWLLFLHWEVSLDALRPLIPAALTIDTFEGRAYVGATAFAMRDVRPWLVPPIPGISNFYELNVRTYVHLDGHLPGVWFFSLDASNQLAVLAARAGFRLPYYHAHMSMVTNGALTQYRSEREPPGPRPAEFEVRYRTGEPLGTAAPGTLEYFLVERYLLYSDWGRSGLKVGPVHHRPYPLQRAEVLDLPRLSLLPADRLPAPAGPPHVLYSPGVDVAVFPLRRP